MSDDGWTDEAVNREIGASYKAGLRDGMLSASVIAGVMASEAFLEKKKNAEELRDLSGLLKSKAGQQ